MRGRRSVSIEAAEEELGSRPAHGAWILRDDGEARVEQVGQQDVVKADQPHLVVLPHPSQGAVGTDGDQVLGGEQRRGWPRRGQHLRDRRLGALDAAKVHADKALIKGNALGGQLLDICLIAGGRRGNP